MTADRTIHVTEAVAAAVERDGFWIGTAPTMEQSFGSLTRGFRVVPVPTTKPCPECGGGYLMTRADGGTDLCPTCNGDGTVPIAVEVVVPEGPCDCRAPHRKTYPERFGDIEFCRHGPILPARTLLRGTAEAVPVVDDPDDVPGEPPVLSLTPMGRAIYWPEGESGPDGLIDVTHHFADVPRPEVGDTAWIIRGEG